MTAETIVQSLLSGLLTGLIYALIAVGLSLIFGLMDVVNFAHGEFLMTAMYATLGFTLVLAIDPIISAPLVAALLFVFGALVYVGIIRFAMRARTNVGMVQIFSTFGLAILMRGLAQFFFTPDYRSIQHAWTSGRTFSVGGVYLPAPQLVGALVSAAAFVGLFLLITRTDFGKALEATREDAGAVALVGINRQPGLHAWLGPRLSARRACGCRHGDVLLHLSRCRGLFCTDRLRDRGPRRLRQRVRRAGRRHHRRTR